MSLHLHQSVPRQNFNQNFSRKTWVSKLLRVNKNFLTFKITSISFHVFPFPCLFQGTRGGFFNFRARLVSAVHAELPALQHSCARNQATAVLFTQSFAAEQVQGRDSGWPLAGKQHCWIEYSNGYVCVGLMLLKQSLDQTQQQNSL